MKGPALRAALATFLAGVALAAWLAEKPFVFLEATPAPFSIDPGGSRTLRVSFDPAREPKDLVLQLEVDGDGPGRVEVHVNGRCASHVRIGPKEKCTGRVPRLFLKGGANEIELRNPADAKLALKPVVFPSHREIVGRAPEGAPVPQPPEIWGEPEYRWEKDEVALWVAVQGEGKAFLADAEVTARLGDRDFAMAKVVRGEVPVRYEASWPLASLRPGPNPVRVSVRAKGHADAEAWFPLRTPGGSSPPGPGTAVRIPFQLAPQTPPLDLAFRIFLPEKIDAPPTGPMDYDGLMGWIASVRGRGGLVYLDRAGDTLRARFEDYVFLTEADGIVVRDEKGWDPAVDPGGFWDRLLHQRQRVGILGPGGPGAAVVADPGWTLEVDLAGVGPNGIGSFLLGDVPRLHVKATAPSKVKGVHLIGDLGGQPGALFATVPEDFGLQIAHPGYFRVVATAEDGSRAVTAPIWIEVRPGVHDRVEQAQEVSWVLGAGREKRTIDFTPEEDGYHILEIGVDPGEKFGGADERLDVSLNGGTVATYRAAGTIHGHDGKAPIRHVVPFRASLGTLRKGVKAPLELSSPAPDDGIAVSYARVLRTALPVLALTDLHAHSRIAENFSNELHRTMGYDYIATAHGGFPNREARKKALETAAKLSDDGMRIEIGGERGDHFGACHVSLAFLTQDLESWDAKDQRYSSAIALAHDWGGVACLNHPSEDSRLGWLRKNYLWGTADPHYHGFAGWAHKEHHYGAGDHYWRLVTIVEYFNGYGAPSIAAGRNEGGYGPRMRWHEEIGRYVRGERRGPLFAVGNTDTKTFQQDQEKLRIGSMYAGTMVHATARNRVAIGASLMAGNSIAACHADTRMLVSVEDAEGRIYHPGNHLIGKGPFKVSVEAWAPRDLAMVRVVGPRGTIAAKALKGRVASEEFRLEGLGPWDWFLVELRGDEPRTAAVSNPFLR